MHKNWALELTENKMYMKESKTSSQNIPAIRKFDVNERSLTVVF